MGLNRRQKEKEDKKDQHQRKMIAIKELRSASKNEDILCVTPRSAMRPTSTTRGNKPLKLPSSVNF